MRGGWRQKAGGEWAEEATGERRRWGWEEGEEKGGEARGGEGMRGEVREERGVEGRGRGGEQGERGDVDDYLSYRTRY